MIQTDIDMPKSCNDCPIQGETFRCRPLVPGIPAWQREISENCADKRSEHCPLIDCKSGCRNQGIVCAVQPII